LPKRSRWVIISPWQLKRRISAGPGRAGRGKVSETEPIVPLRPHWSGSVAGADNTRSAAAALRPQISFDRKELSLILGVYGSKVAEGEWRDYAIDFTRERAVFSIFRRACETPLYRIEKQPRLARRQGLYAVVAPGGMILRRGHDLAQVLKVLVKAPRLVSV
jgi:hypothetical protein